MDEKAINDLALELEGEKADDKAEKAKKLSKKKAQVEYRLAAERKREAKNKKLSETWIRPGQDEKR